MEVSQATPPGCCLADSLQPPTAETGLTANAHTDVAVDTPTDVETDVAVDMPTDVETDVTANTRTDVT